MIRLVARRWAGAERRNPVAKRRDGDVAPDPLEYPRHKVKALKAVEKAGRRPARGLKRCPACKHPVANCICERVE